MMLRVYKLASYAAPVMLRRWIHRRIYDGREHPARVQERYGIPTIPRPAGPLIWIHAASVGEALSIMPLVEHLCAQNDKLNFLITSCTVTSSKVIRPKLNARVMHQFVPYDVPRWVRRFLKHWQPDLAIWVESELWPNLMLQTRARGVPMLLVNARMSEKSFIRWQRYREAILKLLRCFSMMYAGSQDDLRKYKDLGTDPISYIGNIKYDVPALPADTHRLEILRSQIAGRAVWLASSTHAGEEAMTAQVHTQLRNQIPNLLTIIVPRHPARAESILKEIAAQNLATATRSKGQDITPQTDIYLADTLGELGIFYRLVDVVFMGGSLVPHGGHNPIEPAKLGCAILCGPHMFNFQNIVDEMQHENALVMVNDAAALAEKISLLLRNTEARAEMIASARTTTESRTGVMQKIAASVLELLPAKSAESPARPLRQQAQKTSAQKRLDIPSMPTPAFWSSPNTTAKMLRPVAALYRWMARRYTARITPHKIDIPVICVGNLVVGGAGKTPMTIWLAKQLQAMGKNPHFISRGYKGRYEGTVQVDASIHTVEDVGDEPLLLARTAPCWVSRDRVYAAIAAMHSGADCVIMDDGLQNPFLAKNFSLLMVSGGYGFGNGYMLPAGPLREPIASGMAKANAVVLMGQDARKSLDHVPENLPIFRATLSPSEHNPDIRNKTLVAFSGIAQPKNFFDLIEVLGGDMAAREAFPDHHIFSETDLIHLRELAKLHNAELITTEKDAVRLPADMREQVLVISIETQVREAEDLLALLKHYV